MVEPPKWGPWWGPYLLTDRACKNALPGPKDRKLTDSNGLFLLVTTTGYKSWRWKYRFGGKERKLVIGPYPAVSLKSAREARDRARVALADGIDPAAEKAQRKASAALAALDNFEKIARAWHTVKKASWTPRYADAVISRLENNAFKQIGTGSVRDITPPMVLELIRKIEARGARDMAHRVLNHISDVFVFAIASGIAEQDPAAVIRKALEPTDPQLRPALVKLAHARDVIVKTEKLELAGKSTLLASRLLALTAARPGVVRMAERSEFEDLDGPEPLWRIPAAKMKLTRSRKRDVTFEFLIPLSRQAVDVVKVAMQVAPPAHGYLFGGVGDPKKPISDSTLSKLYRLAGFTGKHVPHGWRSSFSTILNERAATEDRDSDRAIIDLMLAHMQEGVEPIYNRYAYMPRRHELAQLWADMLMAGLEPASALLAKPRS